MMKGKTQSKKQQNQRKKTQAQRGSVKRQPRAASTRGAAVAVSTDRQQFTKFSGTSRGEGIRMHSCAAIAQLARETATATGNALVVNGTNNYISMQLNLTQPAGLTNIGTKDNTSYISPIFDLIASAFVRYRVNSLKFHYEPQSAATTTERLVFAFAEDPMHPIIWNATVPSQTGLLALADSVAFAPWNAWSMDVSHRIQNQLFYTFTDSSTTVASFAERFSDFGTISCITSSVSGSLAQCGILYMEIDLELLEFCPISVTLPASKHLANRFAGSAAASSSYTSPKPSVPAESLSKRETRRLCEEAVRTLEDDRGTYAYFRAVWQDRIENDPVSLLGELQKAQKSLEK